MAGLYYEQLEPGLVIDHDHRRTITEMDNVLFSSLTMNTARLHLDEHYMKESQFGSRLVNSLFTLGLMIGMTVNDTTLNTSVANLGFTEIKFPAPLFHGDTVRVQTEVLDRRVSSSKPDTGIVTFVHRAFNQDDKLACECTRACLMQRTPKD